MIEQNHSGTGDNINAGGDIYINTLPRLSSDLAAVVNVLGKRLFFEDESSDKELTSPFDPNKKIIHNNVVELNNINHTLANFLQFIRSLIVKGPIKLI